MQLLRRPVVGVLIGLLVGFALVVAGCGSSDPANGDGMGTARVLLTDAPLSDVQAVHVHITEIQAVSSGHGVVTLVTGGEIPDDIELIALASNPMLLGEPLIPAGDYTQIRLILSNAPGANYIIDADGVRHDLTLPSGAQTGAKLVTGPFTLEEGGFVTILLDFHAAASVHQAGASGMWIMRPTIFAQVLPDVELEFASISGTLLDDEGLPLPVGPNQVLGVFIETPFGPVSVGEVDPTDGTYEIPSILVETYQARVAYADPDGWEPVGDPLDLVVNGTIQQSVEISLEAGQALSLDLVVNIN